VPKLKIDGQEIDVPKGTRVIEAAKLLGIDIPFYCYHPGLSVAGNCRMCLVEIEKMPKLQIACHVESQDGMVIWTNTPKIQATRKHVLEFLLVNHPVDCPVCDQAGECWLQDYYMNYGIYESRLDENKIKKHKAVSIGPTVMLDSERCILCSRCVRFLDEVTKTSELGIINRGDHSEIALFPDKELKNPYSGNVVDICPVGALTDKDFRFKARVWYLKSKPSVCNGCARGCNIEVQYLDQRPHHAGGDRVMRLKPRYNVDINQWWMCDEGRYGYKFHDHGRITKPQLREHDSLRETSWEKAVATAAKQMREAAGNIAVFLSPQMSNEEIYLASQLFKKQLNASKTILISPSLPGFEDAMLIRADKNPNTKGAELLGHRYDEQAIRNFFTACKNGELKGAVIFGQDLLTLYSHEAVASALSKLKWVLFIGSNAHATSAAATCILPAATYIEKEGTFANFQGKIQRFGKILEPLGESRPEIEILSILAHALDLVLPYSKPEDGFKHLTANVKGFENLDYAKLDHGKSDMRVMAEPMIPANTQESPLIFNQTRTAGPNP
jgi:NADH-quinone oxidoreductase subunit G